MPSACLPLPPGHLRQKGRQGAVAAFKGAANDELGMITVVAGATTDVAEIGAFLIKARCDSQHGQPAAR